MTSCRQSHHRTFLRVMLSVALVLAVLHTSLHDLDASGVGNSTQDCDVCHLNNVPFDTPPDTTAVLPILLLSSVLLILTTSRKIQFFRRTLGARAPPSI